MATHTQGEWKVQKDGKPTARDGAYESTVTSDQVSSKTFQVRVHNYNARDGWENLANAKLISAAPDMLAALQELIECDYTSGTHLVAAQQKAKDAIKKATA